MSINVVSGSDTTRIGHGPSALVSEPNRFLTPAELAQRWRWHRESIRRWLRREQVERIKLGKRLLIPLAVIEGIERQGRIG